MLAQSPADTNGSIGVGACTGDCGATTSFGEWLCPACARAGAEWPISSENPTSRATTKVVRLVRIAIERLHARTGDSLRVNLCVAPGTVKPLSRQSIP